MTGEEQGLAIQTRNSVRTLASCCPLLCTHNARWQGLNKYSRNGEERGQEGHISTEIASFCKRHLTFLCLHFNRVCHFSVCMSVHLRSGSFTGTQSGFCEWRLPFSTCSHSPSRMITSPHLQVHSPYDNAQATELPLKRVTDHFTTYPKEPKGK